MAAILFFVGGPLLMNLDPDGCVTFADRAAWDLPCFGIVGRGKYKASRNTRDKNCGKEALPWTGTTPRNSLSEPAIRVILNGLAEAGVCSVMLNIETQPNTPCPYLPSRSECLLSLAQPRPTVHGARFHAN